MSPSLQVRFCESRAVRSRPATSGAADLRYEGRRGSPAEDVGGLVHDRVCACSPEKTLITHIDEGLDFLGWRACDHLNWPRLGRLFVTNVGPAWVVISLLGGGGVSSRMLAPPGLRSPRRCSSAWRSGMARSQGGAVRADQAGPAGRGAVDPGVGRQASGASAHGAAGVGECGAAAAQGVSAAAAAGDRPVCRGDRLAGCWRIGRCRASSGIPRGGSGSGWSPSTARAWRR